MDETAYSQHVNNLEASPGTIAGIVMLLAAIAVFSPYARGYIKGKLASLLWTAGGISLVLLCGWGFFTTYLA